MKLWRKNLSVGANTMILHLWIMLKVTEFFVDIALRLHKYTSSLSTYKLVTEMMEKASVVTFTTEGAKVEPLCQNSN